MCKKELLWRCTGLDSKVGVAISKQKCYDIVLFTDTCMTGFGACFENRQLHGKWSDEDLGNGLMRI